MSTMPNPYVELTYGNTALDFSTRQVLNTPRAERSIEDALRDALMAWRTYAITEARQRLGAMDVVDVGTINKVMDTLWQIYMPHFGRLTLPFVVRSYRAGFNAAGAGDVPAAVLEEMSLDYVKRLGQYFNQTSTEALAQGFTTYVNRRMGTKAAFHRALQAYGLTPRQMSGLLSLKEPPVENGIHVLSRIRGRSFGYIATALRQRLSTIVHQEAHNLDQQADQAAWLWLYNQGRLSGDAIKVWLTARDEKVCSICGPLHNKRVPVLEKFETAGGSLWVPGAHPNCRCEVRLVLPLSLVQKADWDEDEHPRGGDPKNKGRFSAKQRAGDELRQRAAQRRTEFRPVGYADRPEGNVIEPVSEPVIEVTEPFQIKETPKIQIGAPVKASGPIQISGPVNIEEPESVKGGIQISEPVRVRDTTKVPIPVTVAPERRNLMLEDTKHLFNRLNITAPPPPEMEIPTRHNERKVRYSPTRVLPHPVFAVAPKWELDAQGNIDLDFRTEFTGNDTEIAIEANNIFIETIEQTVEEIGYNYLNEIHKYTPDGTELVAEVNSEDVYEIVDKVANDSDDLGVLTFPVEWRHAETGEIVFGEQLPYQYAIDQWGLHPEDFEVIVVRTQKGHDSSLGDTENLFAGTQYGHDVWGFTGRFNARENWQMKVGQSAPISVWDIEPDVEVYDIGNHPEQGPNPVLDYPDDWPE